MKNLNSRKGAWQIQLTPVIPWPKCFTKVHLFDRLDKPDNDKI